MFLQLAQAKNDCQNVAVTTHVHMWGSEMSWSLNDECQDGETHWSNHEQEAHAQECCLVQGQEYTIDCQDSYGDGWHGGYVEIDGAKLCQNFHHGSQQTDTFTLGEERDEGVNGATGSGFSPAMMPTTTDYSYEGTYDSSEDFYGATGSGFYDTSGSYDGEDCVSVNHVNDNPGAVTCDCVPQDDQCFEDGECVADPACDGLIDPSLYDDHSYEGSYEGSGFYGYDSYEGSGYNDYAAGSGMYNDYSYEGSYEGSGMYDYDSNYEAGVANASYDADECAPGCPTHWIGDGICDDTCLNDECQHDANDCDNASGTGYGSGVNAFEKKLHDKKAKTLIAKKAKAKAAKTLAEKKLAEKKLAARHN